MAIERTGIWAHLLLGILLFVATQVDAGNGPARDGDAPKELGRVEWLRDCEAATEHGRREGKPLFLLFQEVPGCQTCVNFGEQVLAHPLLVEAIEDEFVPVAIQNNINNGGPDRRVLERFGEPA